MNAHMILSFALLGGAIVVFAWGRFRYDLVSLVALLAGILLGVVPAKQAFSGFTSEVVVVIASALVVSAAIAKSGVIELVLQPLLGRLDHLSAQVPALAGATALLSILTKNVGALAILMPTALRLGRQKGGSASALLMPMSFMSLLGGLVTLVGTSTNIIVSEVRQEHTGKPFAMFDFAPVGLALTAAGLVLVSLLWRVLPRDRVSGAGLGEVGAAAAFVTEATVSDDWPEEYATLADLGLAERGIEATAIERGGERIAARPDTPLEPGLVLVLAGEDEALAQLFDSVPLEPVGAAHRVEAEQPKEELRTIEAVVQPGSRLIGTSARRSQMQDRFNVKLLAVSRANQRITERLREVRLRIGDVLLLRGGEAAITEFSLDVGLLPLAERSVRFGNPRQRFGPAIILAVAIALVAMQRVPVSVGFFGAAIGCIVIGSLTMREAYGSLEPEVLVLIGALTPLSEALQHTGGTAMIAHHLAELVQGMPPMAVLGVLMVAAMACSPFLHNAPTVLVLGPIALSVATTLRLDPDAFLMAVATGSGCDFLTPVGHQCNTLVMGPGGYRFGDYWKLGLPLSIMVLVIGIPLIAFVWPMQ